MTDNPNRAIYEENYVAAQLEHAPSSAYDAAMLALRLRLLEEHCAGKDALDLCCGSGAFLVKALDKVKSITALDFSRPLLAAVAARIKDDPAACKVRIVEGDAAHLPFPDGAFDTVFSYSSLYYVPNGRAVLAEAGRVLRPGGVAILDLGNKHSLATITSAACHKLHGWAKPYHMSYGDMLAGLEAAGLAVEAHHVFQLLPMFGTKKVQLLLPFSLSLFKRPLGATIGGRMLDSYVSGAPLLRRFAFRHIFVARKTGHA